MAQVPVRFRVVATESNIPHPPVVGTQYFIRDTRAIKMDTGDGRGLLDFGLKIGNAGGVVNIVSSIPDYENPEDLVGFVTNTITVDFSSFISTFIYTFLSHVQKIHNLDAIVGSYLHFEGNDYKVLYRLNSNEILIDTGEIIDPIEYTDNQAITSNPLLFFTNNDISLFKFYVQKIQNYNLNPGEYFNYDGIDYLILYRLNEEEILIYTGQIENPIDPNEENILNIKEVLFNIIEELGTALEIPVDKTDKQGNNLILDIIGTNINTYKSYTQKLHNLNATVGQIINYEGNDYKVLYRLNLTEILIDTGIEVNPIVPIVNNSNNIKPIDFARFTNNISIYHTTPQDQISISVSSNIDLSMAKTNSIVPSHVDSQTPVLLTNDILHKLIINTDAQIQIINN
jgi:hypothetical protein